MEGTPQLLTDVKFTQLRKGGYDPEEVDNYLERINEAVAKLADNLRAATDRAEAAQSQLADARRAQADAESELERVRGGAPLSTGGSADEQLAKVLVLAQRAADQAIEEANTTANKTITDARAKAVNLLADAEQERERLLVKAHKKADAVAEERARVLREQVDSLAAARADLDADVTALTSHLDNERERLRECVESIRTALDDPAGLRVAPPPELLDTPIPVFELAPEPEPERPSPFAPVEPDAFDAGRPELSPTGIDPIGDSGIDDSSALEVAGESSDGDDAAPEVAHGRDTIYLDVPPPPPAEVDASAADSSLFGGEEDPRETESEDGDSGPATELFAPEGEDEDELGPPDAQADAAMKAFFERDLDGPSAASKTRFGRRR
jgi:DivIVA domain-containing protein